MKSGCLAGYASHFATRNAGIECHKAVFFVAVRLAFWLARLVAASCKTLGIPSKLELEAIDRGDRGIKDSRLQAIDLWLRLLHTGLLKASQR